MVALIQMVNAKLFMLQKRSTLQYIAQKTCLFVGYECETHDNPADFILDVINGDIEDNQSNDKKLKTCKIKYKTCNMRGKHVK